MSVSSTSAAAASSAAISKSSVSIQDFLRILT